MSGKIYDIDAKISLRNIVNARKKQECWTCVYGESFVINTLDPIVYCKMKNEYIYKKSMQLCLFYEIKNFSQK